MHDESRTKQISSIKALLKKWEHEYVHTNNCKPSKEDVKKQPEIALLYKQYYELKRESSITPKKAKTKVDFKFQTPTKQRAETEANESPKAPRNDYLQVTPKTVDKSLLGPTPQLSRRVLNLLEDMSPIADSHVDQISDIKHNTSEISSTMIPTTPSKNPEPVAQHTPTVLETPSSYRLQVYTSPNLLRVNAPCRKSLSEMLRELKDIEDDYGSNEEKILQEFESFSSSSSESLVDRDISQPMKKKIKRQNRLVKLPPSMNLSKSHLEGLPEIDEDAENGIDDNEDTTASKDSSPFLDLQSERQNKKIMRNGLVIGKQVSQNYSSYKLKKRKFRRHRS
ncbi:DNA replication preinitiation complex assembly protein [Schizosaccharomyces pombe]|uniref:DNA replication regulator sld2 n=1 Tax=Schizosaccharomyces pombe (strain 972 / ATCC 24843) TaxID=284812 RepID=SLD2_SCHPO|nr:DNA replication checkpoint protein Drc1 [Schizosaccharomyces pombe]O14216.1 RecName: Full=DNA replication regulator sld2; AltName: Full=DNA replication and checkpoint protein 1 [Schizosaccharomyces pombe 972h-]CAB11071.1 DNA replication checkpoint protein Drc1 [Schizosaccharomyces pombe]|eukprot:NP_593766.1 DNA replication checkpoint protein Drc1 [Schizosaccharomyces pombe]